MIRGKNDLSDLERATFPQTESKIDVEINFVVLSSQKSVDLNDLFQATTSRSILNKSTTHAVRDTESIGAILSIYCNNFSRKAYEKEFNSIVDKAR